mmetsp:Transcript_24738/g.28252  ORF Transcript_24738/g.28252 Transcript_24738/m.28252 type:complete len:83 (+) Transcript_24738:254-502(+)
MSTQRNAKRQRISSSSRRRVIRACVLCGRQPAGMKSNPRTTFCAIIRPSLFGYLLQCLDGDWDISSKEDFVVPITNLHKTNE